MELYGKTPGWSDTMYTWGQQCLSYQAQHVHLSEAPLQIQPWAHLEQPTGQQEQQPGKEEEEVRAGFRVPPVTQDWLKTCFSSPTETTLVLNCLSA